jgi:hypothetical protein
MKKQFHNNEDRWPDMFKIGHIESGCALSKIEKFPIRQMKQHNMKYYEKNRILSKYTTPKSHKKAMSNGGLSIKRKTSVS